MNIYLLLASVVLFVGAVESRKAHTYHEKRYHFDVPIADCRQVESNCQECLAKSECVWCEADSSATTNGECRKAENCLKGRKSCNPPASDSREEKRAPAIISGDKVPREIGRVNATMNASAFCAESEAKGCDACTSNPFCFWCDATGSCDSYFNVTTSKETCPTGDWYKTQCFFPVGVLPCQMRNQTCDDCLTDSLCYWCESTSVCGIYPSKDYTPDNCPRDRVYYEECPYAGSLLLVLLPILAIILIPVFIYICIWIICCCMRVAGYEPLGDDSDQAPPGERKHRKGIRLKPGSPSNRTDTLRKKYKLDNP